MTLHKQTLNVKFDTTKLKAFIGKLSSLSMDDIHKGAKEVLESEDMLAEISTMAQQVIWEEIYTVYSPKRYDRTYELMESFKAVASTEGTPGIMVISTDYAAIKFGEYQGEYSYAAFFEGKWKSMIPETAKPVRPFMSILTRVLYEHVKPQIAAAYKAEILKRIKV